MRISDWSSDVCSSDLDIVLLPDAIDEDVDAAAVLRAALQARLPVTAGHELHARREIGEGEEVAVVLRQHFDLPLRDVGANLATLQRTQTCAGDDDRVVGAFGDVRLREVEAGERALPHR